MKVKIAKTPIPKIKLYRFAARKGLDFNKPRSTMGLDAFFSSRKNKENKEKLRTKKTAAKRKEKAEKFSPMRFKASIRKSVAPPKKEAPTKSI
jgi:hypothetical protein